MKTYIKTLFVVVILCSLCFISGCQDALRFAPSEPQKQIALQAHVTARDIEAEGTDAHSPAAKQQVQATQTALTYIGLPKNPQITDYVTTVAQAQVDAGQRPKFQDISEAAEGGLSLAAELAIIFGVGGVGFGGKKLVDWIKLAREKNQALQEIIAGNELFKKQLPETTLRAFKKAQDKTQETPSTKRLVTELKS